MRAVAGGCAHLDVRALVLLSLGVALTAFSFTGGATNLIFALFGFAVFLLVWSRSLARWQNLIGIVIAVMLFIPIKRYHLPAALPFDLEPYRLAVAMVALAWLGALLVDPRVRLHKSGLEAPIFMILATIFLSDAFNPGRVAALGSDVLKAQTFFLSFFVVFYLIVSVVRTRVEIEFLVKLLVAGGALVAAAGIVERRTGYNVFNQLSVVPFLDYEGAEVLERGGRLRVRGSAQHPIALGALFALLLPLSVYLIHRYGPRRWLLAASVLTLGVLATASRTGVVAVAVVGLVFLVLQPRTVWRLWPAVVPALLAIHLVLPGALGTVRASFFPREGLVAQQSKVVPGSVGTASGRLADLGPSLTEFSRQPLLGQGFATRVTTGPRANARLLDNQWLKTLLETGALGIGAWLWLLFRSTRRFGRAARGSQGEDGWLFTALAASTAAFGVTLITYDAFSFVQAMFIFFIILALGVALMNVLDRYPVANATSVELSAIPSHMDRSD